MHLKDILISLKSSSLAKDSFWALFGNVIRQGLALISGIVVARFLGKEIYGEFGTIRTTLVYIAIVSTFGFGYTATKYVAECLQNNVRKLKSLVSIILKVTCAFSALLALLLFVFSDSIAVFIDAPHLSETLKVASPVVVMNAINSTQIAILSGFKEFKVIARINAYSGGVTFVSSIGFTYWWGLNGAVFALLIAFLFQAILNAAAIRKIADKYEGNSHFAGERNTIKDQVRSLDIAALVPQVKIDGDSATFTCAYWRHFGGLYIAETRLKNENGHIYVVSENKRCLVIHHSNILF